MTEQATPADRARLAGLLVSLAALALFGFGLLGPLTPSYGCPSRAVITGFVAVPALLAAGSSLWARGLAGLLLALQAIAISGAAAWLLARIGCLG